MALMYGVNRPRSDPEKNYLTDDSAEFLMGKGIDTIMGTQFGHGIPTVSSWCGQPLRGLGLAT